MCAVHIARNELWQKIKSEPKNFSFGCIDASCASLIERQSETTAFFVDFFKW